MPGEACIECGATMTVVLEVATCAGVFDEERRPAVIEHHHCAAEGCAMAARQDGDYLVLRKQESPWVRRVFGLHPARERQEALF